jgi:hypothetical protein
MAAGARVSVGPHRIDFLAPLRPESPLQCWLARRGPSPYSASLTSASTKGQFDLDEALGARLSLV